MDMHPRGRRLRMQEGAALCRVLANPQTDADERKATELDDAAILTDLMLRIASQGDRTAFRHLYELTAPRIYALCLRLMRTPPRAEDMMQEVFLLVWRKARHYSPARGPVLPWMLMIARNRAISDLRLVQPGLDPIDDEPDMPDATIPADQQISDQQMGLAVRSALSGLPDNLRHALELAFFEGLAYPEVAVRMGVPLNTAKSWIRRALIRLRQGIPAECRP